MILGSRCHRSTAESAPMKSTSLAERAHAPEQDAEWAALSAHESAGRRARNRRGLRLRHPRLWDWPRIVTYTLIPTAWFLAVLRWA